MKPLLLLFFLAAVAGAQLRVGTATADITPRTGTPMPGYYYNRGSDGVHDPLLAKALVLEHNGQSRPRRLTSSASPPPSPNRHAPASNATSASPPPAS